MSDVSRETELFERYAGLLRKWNPVINLISPATVDELESRHIADSRRLVEVSLNTTGTWVDLGSGGGLPGLVVAISRPDLNVSLVESDQRKASFLRTVIRELSINNAEVIVGRIEKIAKLDAANISARALAPLPQLMAYVSRHLNKSGRAWLMKGKSWQFEVDEARKVWSFDMKAHPSLTEPEAAILEITRIGHV